MPNSTGTQLAQPLMGSVDRLWVQCVNTSLQNRQAVWDRGLISIKYRLGRGFESVEMEDALQDAGFKLGLFAFNAKTARFSGSKMG